MIEHELADKEVFRPDIITSINPNIPCTGPRGGGQK